MNLQFPIFERALLSFISGTPEVDDMHFARINVDDDIIHFQIVMDHAHVVNFLQADSEVPHYPDVIDLFEWLLHHDVKERLFTYIRHKDGGSRLRPYGYGQRASAGAVQFLQELELFLESLSFAQIVCHLEHDLFLPQDQSAHFPVCSATEYLGVLHQTLEYFLLLKALQKFIFIISLSDICRRSDIVLKGTFDVGDRLSEHRKTGLTLL